MNARLTAAVILLFAAGAAARAQAPVGAPCGPKVCVAEPTIKKTSKNVYTHACHDFCVPRCSLLSLLCGKCGCEMDCGPVHTKRVLVKKTVTTECPDVKCVPKIVPPCEAPCRAPAHGLKKHK